MDEKKGQAAWWKELSEQERASVAQAACDVLGSGPRAVVLKLEPRRRRRTTEANRAKFESEAWADDDEDHMTEMVRAFPSLMHAEGVEPWDVHTFLRWTEKSQLNDAAIHAVRFVLEVWSPSTDWRTAAARFGIKRVHHLGPFRIVEAVAAWDDAHRDAFLAWCEAPFTP